MVREVDGRQLRQVNFLIPVKDEMRIIRSCGWLPNPAGLEDRDCFTRTGTHSVRDRVILFNNPKFLTLSFSFFVIYLQIKNMQIMGH